MMDAKMVGAFFSFMAERHAIYERRAAGQPKPWTADPVLQQYRFCNVFRELDTVTVWIDKHIRQPYADHPNLWFMLCIARYINHPPTLEGLMSNAHIEAWPGTDKWDAATAACILDARKARGEQVYTGAYMIRAESSPSKHWYTWTKQQYICKVVLGQVWNKRVEFLEVLKKPWLEEAHAWLMHQYGWGGFMAYEVVTDLRHTRYLNTAPDIMTWANPGPGAARGLLRIAHEGANTGSLTRNQQIDGMRELLGHAAEYWDGPALEMRDIEHSLCEFDKYLRVARGEGKPRSKYPGA